MGRRRTGVNKIRDIIRYGQTTDLSERQIARALGISRTVVARTLQTFRASGLQYSAAEQLPDSELQQNLERGSTPKEGARYKELATGFPEMVVELKKKWMTLQWLWERYIHEHPQGYQYSQYCLHFHRWRRSEEVSMHIEYKAGEAMLVDWAGDKLEVINGTTGQSWALDQFVAILGASELTYVEARESQEEAQWIRANEGAFRYFGGVTSALIPDNLKTAVIRSDPYEPGLNPVFEDFAHHYGVVIMPTRVRRPRDKALVEGAVRLVYQRISARLRGQVFHSLVQVNAAIRELLEEHNRRPFSRLPYSRRQLFERVEMAALRPLPAEPFALKTTIEATVDQLSCGTSPGSALLQRAPSPAPTRAAHTGKGRLRRSGGGHLLGQRARRSASSGSYTQRLHDTGRTHALKSPLVRGVERGEVPELGGDDGAPDRGAHRQGAFCCRLPTPGVPQLPGHPESGKTPRFGSSEQGLRQGAACGHAILYTDQKHAGLGFGGRESAPFGPGSAAGA